MKKTPFLLMLVKDECFFLTKSVFGMFNYVFLSHLSWF